jgi:hypothetical protein
MYAGQSTMLIDEHYGDGAAPFALVGWCVVLLGSAAWLNHVLFRRLTSILPFLAAIFTTLSIWVWQKLSFTALIPNGELKYGYFLNPEGAKARFATLLVFALPSMYLDGQGNASIVI